MADGEKNKKSIDRTKERFKYIGFDVFPGEPGDMFKTEEDRKSWVEKVRAKLSRSQDEVRDRCTLMESRVSGAEKVFLTLAAAAMVLALFLPWFSGYIPVSYEELGSFEGHSFYYASTGDEKGLDDLAKAVRTEHEGLYAIAGESEEAEEPPAAAEEEVLPADSTDVPGQELTSDSSIVTGEESAEEVVATSPEEEAVQSDPTGANESDEDYGVREEIRVIFVDVPQIDQIHGVNDLQEHILALYTFNARTGQEQMVYGNDNAMRALPEDIILGAQRNDSISAAVTDSLKQSVIERIAEGDSTLSPDSIFFAGPALVKNKAISELASKGILNDHYSITGIGALMSIGTYGAKVFSGGVILVITGALMLIYFLCSLVLAAFNFFLLYGPKKGSEDQWALRLKRMLRYNWVPIMLWLTMFVLSFFGASYGFNSSGMLAQVGDSYSIVTFIGLSSFGIYVTLAAFLIAALKGKEI